MTDAKNVRSENRLKEIALAFLRLGFIAFGGAAAHIALMEEEFVRRRGWLSREEFVDRVGAVNLLPGPSSTEMAIYLGQLRGGFLGLLIAGAAFILPSALMMCMMAWAYVRYGALPQIAGVLWGVKPVVVVLIAQAVWSLGKTVLKSRELMAIAAMVLGLAAMHVATLALLIGTGVAWIVANRFGQNRDGRNGIAAAAVSAAGGAAVSATVAAATTTGVFAYFLKIGTLLFGSGYVLLAVLREDLVARMHWLSEAQLLDGIAVSQATPGPFFTVATFLGYVLSGWRGAGLATVGMFVPAFVYVAVTANVLPRLRKSPTASAFLDGVNAAAVALMAFVGLQFAREAVVTPLAAVIAAISAVLAFRLRVNSAWLILGGAVCGLLVKVSGLG
ncbi:MAG TPA: chromate efflux transporter [Candidatus Acidoferrum sp.]|nr:chromate efflux transporter [Candidatus Acidoferrum sp.]